MQNLITVADKHKHDPRAAKEGVRWCSLKTQCVTFKKIHCGEVERKTFRRIKSVVDKQ